ncbi:hypothetical protein VNO77_33792 [Canavalia gladiata]|uniref:Uncharacterized protein n=1 Tax=Canavalia gladiata TaxID=3824 RepID=A0AAN9KE04_CANGL
MAGSMDSLDFPVPVFPAEKRHRSRNDGGINDQRQDEAFTKKGRKEEINIPQLGKTIEIGFTPLSSFSYFTTLFDQVMPELPEPTTIQA